MGTENIKLSKGDQLTLKGQAYQMAAQAKIRVMKKENIPLEEEEVTGEAKSDANDDRFKKAACRIVESKIKALEQKEIDSLFLIEEDDVLFSFDGADEVPKALISNHVGATNTILDLKQILKKIKAL